MAKATKSSKPAAKKPAAKSKPKAKARAKTVAPKKLAASKAKKPSKAPIAPQLSIALDDRGLAMVVNPNAPKPKPVVVAPPPAPVRLVPVGPDKELDAERDVARMLRYGEMFGAHRIEIEHSPTPVAMPTGTVALADLPTLTTSKRAAETVLARRVAKNSFRVMHSLVKTGGVARIVAAVMYVGRPPIARWVFAHAEGKRPPKTIAEAPSIEATTIAITDASLIEKLKAGAKLSPPDLTGAVALHVGAKPAPVTPDWGLSPEGTPVCLLLDFNAFSASDWRAQPVKNKSTKK